MKVSALIPAYNCEVTIRATLDSVLAQTRLPDEILVMNDGSTDNTASILESYKPRIKVLWQPNSGVASALNALCKQAQGALIAVLGSDDIWHTRYLEAQLKIFQQYPHAVAFFTGHVSFSGDRDYEWSTDPFEAQFQVEIINPLKFLKQYNAAPGPFSCMSHCCVPKWVLRTLGDEPFKLRMAEDLYFFNLLAPSGPIVFVPVPLAAYRVREGSLSSNRLKLTEAEVRVFELLEDYYKKLSNAKLTQTYKKSFASKRRLHAKVLLGAGMISQGRAQLWRSLIISGNPISMTKSLGLLVLSYLPPSMQPAWPSSHREWKSPESA